MAKVVWHKQAIADLDRIIRYIEQFDATAAQGFGTRLFDLGQSLCDFPHRGRPTTRGRRELATIRPYILLYAVDGDEVSILSIRHGAQLSPTDD